MIRWRGDLGAAIHAEWTKQRTLPGTIWLLAATTLVCIAVGTAAVAATTCDARAACPIDPARLSLTGIQVSQAVVAVLAVLAFGGEYSTGMIRSTLAAVPSRVTLLAAKAITVTAPVLLAGAVAVAGSMLAGRLLLPSRGLTLSLADGPVLRAAIGSVLYLALIALLALGMAAAVRDTAVAIGLVLGLLYLFPIVAAAATDPHWRRHVEQVSPMTAGLEIQATTNLHTLPIGPVAGLAVLAAWAAAALLGGGVLLRARDA